MTYRTFLMCCGVAALLASAGAAGAACTPSGVEMADARAAIAAAGMSGDAPVARADGAPRLTRSDAIVVSPMLRPLANAPSGSCLLRDGSWCWPVSPTSFGQPCTCPNGARGVGQ